MIADWKTPAISIAVVDGEEVYAKGFGTARLDAQTPATEKTLYMCGSTSKAFTAMIMAQLVADNENYPHVQWRSKVRDLIPDDFAMQNEYASDHATIEDAMSHRTGLPAHDWAYGSNDQNQRATVKEMVQSIKYLPMVEELRQDYQYNNLMFMVMEHVIQTLTNTSLKHLVEEKIFEPLGFEGSFFSPDEETMLANSQFAKGYAHVPPPDGEPMHGGRFAEVPFQYLPTIAGAGGVVSNVLDYAKWCRAILSLSPILLSNKEDFSQFWIPRSYVGQGSAYSGPTTYGLAWETAVYNGKLFHMHSGGMNAYGAYIYVFPNEDYAVIGLGNTALSSNNAELPLLFELINDRFDIPQEKRFNFQKEDVEDTEEEEAPYSFAQAMSDFYNITSDSERRPLPLALDEYSGRYFDPGYKNLYIHVSMVDIDADGNVTSPTAVLQASRDTSSWTQTITWRHVSDNTFLCYSTSPTDTYSPGIYACEFKVGADSEVQAAGIQWSDLQQYIWLERK